MTNIDAIDSAMSDLQIATSSGFLGLPAELRNYIYEISCGPPCPIYLRPATVQLVWAAQKRQSFGLTQTCRQIRGEFMAMHLDCHPCRIPFQKFRNFYCGFKEHTEGLQDILQLDFERRFDPNTAPLVGVDILPLLKVYANMPCFCLEIPTAFELLDRGDCILSDFKNSLRGYKNATRLAYIHTALEGVLVWKTPFDTRLTFVVKLEHAEDWMGNRDGCIDMDKDWTSADGSAFMSSADRKKRFEDVSGLRFDAPKYYRVEVAEWIMWRRAQWKINRAIALRQLVT
ncbi:hypothetical protein CC86DRAFT_424793 [Ophiobolus disseminans]|uniref:Uncharacterized protein n=1 Tax=Ophiobolus disseminans TaxID=1469910 RepID=A0A6A7AGU7_9PLEO|nr:hypothetical protein CC86DRAFT_424793 [Ophiobolus disseminans]